ncbi:MAG: hypothetical protein V1790_01490 [Planctomycetota bacterium]
MCLVRSLTVAALIRPDAAGDGAQVEILADIARTFRHEEIRQKAVEVRSYIELLALVRTQGEPGKPLVQ